MLRFPSMLNEKLDTFRAVIEAARAPTKPQLELYAEFDKQVNAQASAWKALVAGDSAGAQQEDRRGQHLARRPSVPPPAAPTASGGRAEPDRD